MNRLLPAWRAMPMILLFGCEGTPDDLREWRPSDHRHASSPATQQTSGVVDTSNPVVKAGLDEVILATWRRSCVTCHGPIGRGDGPQGAMVKARDLTSPAWQASVTDEQLASIIVNGRGSMPAFDLPESTVDGLVRLVRLLNRQRAATASSSSPPAHKPRPSADLEAPRP